MYDITEISRNTLEREIIRNNSEVKALQRKNSLGVFGQLLEVKQNDTSPTEDYNIREEELNELVKSNSKLDLLLSLKNEVEFILSDYFLKMKVLKSVEEEIPYFTRKSSRLQLLGGDRLRGDVSLNGGRGYEFLTPIQNIRGQSIDSLYREMKIEEYLGKENDKIQWTVNDKTPKEIEIV